MASMLNLKLDIIVSRKIGAPYNPELAIGAVMPDGSFFPNEDVINTFKISQWYIAAKIEAEVEEIRRSIPLPWWKHHKHHDRNGSSSHTTIKTETVTVVVLPYPYTMPLMGMYYPPYTQIPQEDLVPQVNKVLLFMY